MDCIELRQALLRGEAIGAKDVNEHRLACLACRELYAQDSKLAAALGTACPEEREDAALTRAVTSAVARDSSGLARVKAFPTWQRAAFVASVGAVPCGLPWVLHEGVADLRTMVGAGLAVATATISLALLMAPLHRVRRTKTRGAVLAVAIAIPWAFGLALAGSGSGETNGAFACLVYGALVSAPFAAVLELFEHRVRRPALEDWLAGATTGLLAHSALLFHCANRQPAHLLAGHASLALFWLLLAVVWSTRGAATAPGR